MLLIRITMRVQITWERRVNSRLGLPYVLVLHSIHSFFIVVNYMHDNMKMNITYLCYLPGIILKYTWIFYPSSFFTLIPGAQFFFLSAPLSSVTSVRFSTSLDFVGLYYLVIVLFNEETLKRAEVRVDRRQLPFGLLLLERAFGGIWITLLLLLLLPSSVLLSFCFNYFFIKFLNENRRRMVNYILWHDRLTAAGLFYCSPLGIIFELIY